MENVEKIENPKYCSKDVGEILYRDKLIAIQKYEIVANLIKKYIKNTDYSTAILNDLKKEVTDGKIINIKPIDSFPYDNEYLKLLNTIEPKQLSDNRFICRGLTDKGYLEVNNDVEITKDLQVKHGFTIVSKDIVTIAIAKDRKPERILTYIESEYINSLKINSDEKVLLIGSDLGYLGYKHPNKEIYLYDEDIELSSLLKENIYNALGITVNFVSDSDIEKMKFDKIIINPSLDLDIQYKLYSDLKLYNYDNIFSPKLNLIINKFKLDFQDIIIADKEQVVESLLEGLKEMKGMGQTILGAQLDFIDKAEVYLDKNHIYFDSYKKFQKAINKSNIIFEILKTEIES